MEIIVVADKQASKYLSNRENLSTVDGRPVTIADIVDGVITGGPFIWVGGHWVYSSPDILIHNQQITNKAEAEALLSCLKDDVGRGAGSVGFRGSDSYDTIIVGCDPDVAEGYLVTALEEYFGYEDITMTFPPLGEEGTPDPRLLDKVNKLLYSTTVGEAGISVLADVGGVGKVVVVVDEQASGFLSNPWNYGAYGSPDVVTRNIVDPIKVAGLKGEGRLFWNGKRWVDVYPRVAVHEKQVTKISEVPGIIGGLLTGKYETAIIGCDPSASIHFTRRLREVFGPENVIDIYPHLGEGFEEYKDLGDRLKELLGRSTDGAGSVSAEDGAGAGAGAVGTEGAVKGRALSLKITLADTGNVIDIVLDEGTHLELDFRDGTQETA